MLVGHAGHGDQELVRQVDGAAGTCRHFIDLAHGNAAATHPRRPAGRWMRRWSGSGATCARRPRGAVPRAAPAPRHVVVRLRVRPRHPRPPAAGPRGRPRRVHPRQPGGVDCRRGALAALGRAPAADGCGLVVHGTARRDRSAAWRASWACRRSTPTTTTSPRRCSATPSRAGLLARHGIALHPRRTTSSSSAARCSDAGPAPYSVFTPYKNAWLKKLDPLCDRYPVETHAAAGAVPTAFSARRADARIWASAHQPARAEAARWAGRRAHADDFLPRIDRLRPHARLPGGQGAELPERCTCASAPLSIRRWRAGACAMPGPAAKARVVVGADLARLLPPDPAPPSARRGPRLQAEYDASRWGTANMPRHVRRLVRGRTGYPLVGRRPDAPARRPATCTTAAHGGGELPDQGPGHRLAARRAWVRRPPLNDFDLAANNGGWQWAASTGCDAQPWFRIFNPVAQSRRSIPQGASSGATCRNRRSSDDNLHAPWEARPWIWPRQACDWAATPGPIVRHAEARERTLARYAAAVKKRA